MIKVILPTDFSENSKNAIAYALTLFKEEACAFYLLNTFLSSSNFEEYPWHSSLEQSDSAKAMTRLTALLDNLSKKFKNPKHIFVPHSAMNTVVGEVNKLIEQENIDLVVMGTQGLTGAKDILFGTNAIQVIRNVSRPVIVVPSAYTYRAPEQILFPTDFEITYHKEQLNELLHLARQHRSHISILHVAAGNELTEDQLVNKSSLEELIKDIDYQLHIVSEGDIRSVIYNYLQENNISLLVMIQNKHTFMERLFLRSEIKQIGLHVNIPFMVIPWLSNN